MAEWHAHVAHMAQHMNMAGGLSPLLPLNSTLGQNIKTPNQDAKGPHSNEKDTLIFVEDKICQNCSMQIYGTPNQNVRVWNLRMLRPYKLL